MDELDDVLRRPEVLTKLHLTRLEARALLVRIRHWAHLVTPTATIRRCRDPDDDKFLECAVAGAADYVVSADDDLLSLGAIEGIPILDVPTFWRRLSEAPSSQTDPTP